MHSGREQCLTTWVRLEAVGGDGFMMASCSGRFDGASTGTNTLLSHFATYPLASFGYAGRDLTEHLMKILIERGHSFTRGLHPP